MNVWSTEHLPRRDRFEYWRAERGRRLCGADIEVEPERRLDFTGRIAAAAVGGAMVVELGGSPYALRRTPQAIDRAPERTFAIWQVTRGSGVLLAGGTEEAIGVGTITSGCSDLPYAHLPEDGSLNTFRGVRIPVAMLPAAASPEALIACKYAVSPGIGALFAAYFTSFMEQAPELCGPAADQAVQTLVHLALAARGAGEAREGASREAVCRGLLARAQRLIETDLHRGDLTPARAAAQLGISVRKLHLVFEPSGESFARHLLARRLARADRLLRGSPDISVTQAAYASGFESLSTFFRGYRSVFGASPGERRSVPAEPRDTGRAARPDRVLSRT